MPPEPLVIGFDTSAAHCAAALLSGDRLLARRHENMARGQAERLFPLLEEMLDEAGATWAGLSRIAVGTGPGNFTGTRLSVSAARGLALSLGIPALGVSGFEALALGAPRPVLSSIDAHAGRLHLQRLTADGPEPARTLNADRLAQIGPGTDARTTTVVGFMAGDIARATGARAAAPVFSIAEAIARIAAARRANPDERPAPFYMRPPDARPPRETAPVILP